jgi:hypothetical protein
MKVLVSLGLAAACLIASPALAGPAGVGLTFTEEVAKKTLQKRAAGVQAATAACAAPKPDAKTEPVPAPKDGAPETCRAS